MVDLAPGESERVRVLIEREDLAYWDIRGERWVVEGGDYEVRAAASSRDIRSAATVEVTGDEFVPAAHTEFDVGRGRWPCLAPPRY
ncbi:fibronectin type III-like domain-contianing protein [Streptomyces sp. KL116D]|uniref:fibronectin type III-like domain-contianing protein n=1 Tax=Streptomyces sp. KL116D TaxID=3045152 RepID=UPI003556B04A